MNSEKINFYGQTLETVRGRQGEVWVAVRPICEGIGVDWKGQWSKLTSDPKFSCGDITTTGRDGKSYNMCCINIHQVNGWLFSINANKVKEEVRPRLLKYQHECLDVLYKHFMPRSEADLSSFMGKLDLRFDVLEQKLDKMNCVAETVFGDDCEEIQDLVQAVADKYKVDGRTVWGWVQIECDVSSYKKQNVKVKKFLLNKLGRGVFGVVEGE